MPRTSDTECNMSFLYFNLVGFIQLAISLSIMATFEWFKKHIASETYTLMIVLQMALGKERCHQDTLISSSFLLNMLYCRLQNVCITLWLTVERIIIFWWMFCFSIMKEKMLIEPFHFHNCFDIYRTDSIFGWRHANANDTIWIIPMSMDKMLERVKC